MADIAMYLGELIELHINRVRTVFHTIASQIPLLTCRWKWFDAYRFSPIGLVKWLLRRIHAFEHCMDPPPMSISFSILRTAY